MRPSSLTDRSISKYQEDRSIEEKGMASARVNEGIEPEFIGIVNYCAIALIQLRIGPGDYISQEKVPQSYMIRQYRIPLH